MLVKLEGDGEIPAHSSTVQSSVSGCDCRRVVMKPKRNSGDDSQFPAPAPLKDSDLFENGVEESQQSRRFDQPPFSSSHLGTAVRIC